MPENDILYTVRLSDGRTDTLTQQQYDSIKDKLYADDSGAEVVRTSVYDRENDDVNDSDVFHIKLKDGRTDQLSRAQFEQIYEPLTRDNPDAEIYKVSNASDQYWRPKLDEARAALNAFNQEHGQALNQYESYEYLAQQSEQGEVPNFNSPSHKWLREHEAEYLPLKEQRDALRSAVYNNPIVSKGRKQAYDNAISLREQYLDLATKASNGAERRDYKRAAKLQGDAAKLFAAPGQYDEDGEKNGFEKYMEDYGKGAMHTFSDRDFWTRGLTQIARDIDLYGIRKKIQDAQKAKGAELDESDFDRIISPSEKAELFAFYNLARAQSDDVIGRANDLSSAFKAGQSATESLGFMAEFLLSQGLANVAGKAMSASANGFVRWMGQALMSDKALARAVQQGVTAIPEMSKLAKVGSELARPLIQGLWHTGTQLSTLSSMAEMMNQTNDDGELNSVGRGLWLGFADSFVENWSESLGNTMDKGFDLAIGGIGKWGQQTLGGTKFGRMARWALNSPFTQTLKEAGFNGFFGEMLEEWAGNAVRLSTGLMDKDEFKQFASIEQQLEMAASFAPMSLFGLGGQVIGGVRHNKEYNRLSQQVKDILLRNNVSQASIDELFKTKFDTPEDVAAKLAPYAQQVLNSGSETAKEDYKKILQLAEETGIQSFAESMQEMRNQERRDQMRDAIAANTGKFWQDFDSPEAVDENGDPEQIHQVRVVEYADGTRRYITAGVPRLVPVRENDGIEVYREVVDLNAPGGREYATVDENGNKGFINDQQIRDGLVNGTITSDREVMLEEYLQERVDAVDKSEEAKRMQAEIQAKLATVMERIKQDPNFNMGTPEAPIPAMVTAQDNNGVIVTYNKDGNDYYTSMTWQEVGNYLGMPITAKTDAEIAEDTAKMQQAALERKDRYNKIPAGTEFIVTMPGAEGDEQVPYKFAKAIYDEGEGSVRIYVADEAGNIMTDRNGEEVWFPEEMVPGLEQLAEQSLTPAEAEKEVVEEVVPEEPESAQQAVVKYTKEDGKVNQTAFIKNEPEEWAKWNDERRQDGGANSKERLSAAISDLDKQINELNKKKAATANPDDADAIEEQVNELAQRHARLKAIYDGYVAREQAAKAAEDAARRAEFEAAAAKKKEEERKAAAKIQDDLKEDASFVELAENYANQKKTYGEKDTYNVGGRKFKGRWVVAEATTPKPSHNPLNDFAPTPGYPIGKAGNSNHYDKDKRAQQITREMSDPFDERAVQEPVVVTKHGIVLSGNGRTQARLLAAQQQTDAEYKEYIREHAKKWGLTTEEVDEYANPILYFELEEDVEYSAALFDAFNRSTSKQQSATETAAKVAQMTSEELVMRLDRLFREIGDSIDNLYKNPEKVNELLNMLQAAGIFNSNERARYVDEYGNLSGAGEDLVESVLFGTIFDTSDDAVRSAMNDKAVRRAVTFAFPTLVRLRNLSGELSLIGELTEAVSLLSQAKAANGGKAENAVIDYMLQGNLWTGETPIVKATVQLLAHVLNDGKYGSLRAVLNQYIERAEAANYGQAIFTEEGTIEVENKERILRDVLAHNKINIETYGNTAAAQPGVSANDEVRPASGEQGSSGSPADGTGEVNPAGVQGEGNPAPQVEGDEAQEPILETEEGSEGNYHYNEDGICTNPTIITAPGQAHTDRVPKIAIAERNGKWYSAVYVNSDTDGSAWGSVNPAVNSNGRGFNTKEEAIADGVRYAQWLLDNPAKKAKSETFNSAKALIDYATELSKGQQTEAKSSIQGLEHRSEEEIKSAVEGQLLDIAMSEGKDGFRIKKITIIGSRANGTAKADSDLDVLVEYEGTMREDDAFNAANAEPLVIDGIKVDINPINTAKSGTTEQWLKAHPAEAKPAAKQQQEGPVDLLKLAKEQAKKNRKLQKILKRVEKWVNFLGNGAFEIATGIEDVEKIEDEATRQQILDQINAGKIVEGWFANGKAVIYLPNIPNERTLDRKIMHEVISHKGIKGLFEAKGKGEFDKFCDWVWGNLMNDAARSYFMNYPGVVEIKDLRARQRAAADEFLAHCAEEETAVIAQLDEDFWSRLVEALKTFVNDAMGEDIFGEEDNWFADLLKEAAKSVQQGTATQQEETGALFSVANAFSKSSEEFDSMQKLAEQKHGIVATGLYDVEFPIKEVPRHSFTGSGRQAIEQARKWAEGNLVGSHKYHEGRADEFSYEITGGKNGSVGEMLTKISTQNSDNLGVHLAVLRELPAVIDASFDIEIHADYTKENGHRTESSKINPSTLIHRLYGAVSIDGQIYRVKTTIEEHRNRENNAYTYQVTKVELLKSGSATSNALSNSTISAANLLKGVEKSYDLGKKLLDAEYLDAVETGDMAKAQELVNKAAEAAGYTGKTDYQGSLAFNGAAPSSNAYYETREERKAAFEDGSFEGDYSLGDFMKAGLDNNDLHWQLDNPIPASARDKATLESIKNLAAVVKGKKGTIKMYRAVPADITEESFRNGDWITPSRLYAEHHIELQDWQGGRIIEQEVPVDDIWWNGDDINEWGFDDGKGYAYQNTPNNRKLLDPVTYDDNGNVIPLSQRFNPENPDVRFSVAPAVREEMDAIKEAAQADGTFMKAPNGKDTNLSEDQWLLVRTKNFKQWFGDWQSDKENASKILDNNGEPAVCFHGSTWNPEAEEPGDAVFKDSFRGTGSGDNGFFGRGFYFTYQDGSSADGKAARAEANYYGGNITAAFLNIRNPFMFKETLETYKKDKNNYGSEKESVMILNMVKHFPELVKDYRIDVVDSEGNVSGEITLEEYAKIFEDTYKDKEFIIREGRDERDRNIVELCADPVHHEETINGQKVEWDDYGFRMDMYRPGANEDAQLAYTHYYLTYLNDMWREDHTGVAYNFPSHMFSSLFESEEFTHALKEKGYDGVLQSATGDEAVAFKAKQIKSATGNTGEYSETKPDIRFSLIGEKGAARMDATYGPIAKRMETVKVPSKSAIMRFLGKEETMQIESAVTRIGNLDIAKQMEQAGATAESIKIATGWEKGKDGKWRYEESDVKLNEELIKSVQNNEAFLGYVGDDKLSESEKRKVATERRRTATWPLAAVLENDEAFKKMMAAYPELGDIKVSFYNDSFLDLFDATRGYYNPKTKTLMLNPREAGFIFKGQTSLDELRSTVTHELQHIIQGIEGFASGGNTNIVDKYGRVEELRKDRDKANEELEATINADQELAKLKKAYESKRDEPSDEYREHLEKYEAAKAEYERKKKEYDDRWEDTNRRAEKYNKARANKEITPEEYNFQLNRIIRERNEIMRDFPTYPSYVWFTGKARKYSYDDVKPERDAYEARLKEVRQREDIKELEKKVSDLNDGIKEEQYRLYKSIAGEVEARNVQKRLGMSEEERRRTLAEVTEDIPREDQIILNDKRLSQKDIRFSVSQESQELFDAAKKRFGVTKDLNEAGYILPDGTLLDFSGRHADKNNPEIHKGRRQVDHRDIADLNYEEDLDTPSGIKTRMSDFINRGAIRMHMGSRDGSINLNNIPTPEQEFVIRRIVDRYNGDVAVDFGDGENTSHYAYYQGVRPARVMNDINRYFNDGVVPEGNLRFSVADRQAFDSAQQLQKQPGMQLPEDVADIRFSISKNNRQTIQAWLRKRTDLSEAQRDALVKYLESLDNPKLQLATAKWFSQGVIRLPEDMSKVEQAVSFAGKAKVDPLQYGSPMELLEAHAEFKPTEKRINPDDVPTLHKAAEYKEQGVVIYDVDDTEESRQNMREIINSHFGKEASPWCLLQGDGNGKLTAASAQYWRNYSAYPKQVAFKDGKLLAFSANDREKRLWWDRQDMPHAGIPVTMKMPNDKLGRTATYDLDPETGLLGNQTDVHRGNKQNGTYETWTNDGKTQLSRTQYKNGKRNGLAERWHQSNGELWVRATYKDGLEIEYESWYDNGNPWRVSHYDSDGVKQGEELEYHENGQMAQRWHFKDGRWDGLKERWNPEGILIERTEFKEGRRHGTEERWFDMGEKMSVTHYDNGLKNGLMEEWYWNGNKRSEIMYDHDLRVGVSKTWHESGNLKSRVEYDDEGAAHGVAILYHDKEGAIYTREHWNHGERHGLSEQFRPDGQLVLRDHWNSGKRDGLSERWFDNGMLAERKTYKDGKEDGEKCMWDSGGRLWYHYEMKDGNEVRNLGGINMPGTARFSIVTDEKELERLEKEPTITLYRAMELIDGELYPPMSQKVPNAKENKGKKMQRREGVRPGMWQKSDEDPAKAYQKEPGGPWYYDLKKLGKKSDVNGVLYNPYLHLSASPLNDQFTSAYTRPNLVIVACEVPISELSSGYKAEKANDSVGAKDWHSGTVTAQLGEGRQVVLSRWAKISRIVPDSEVAAMVAPKLVEKNIVVPTNVVTPSLRAALEARGVKFAEPDGEDVRFSVRQGTLFTADGEAVRYQSEGGLPKQEGRTSYVERTYRNRGDFSFMGKDKIETSGDVAYIFKELETSAVENSFIVYVKDGIPTILHTGIGNIESVGIDETAFAAGLNDFAPDMVYMVHNHPSGRVEASRADISMLEVLQRMAGKVPVKGVIIDTLSGQYGEFSYNSFPNTKVNEAAKENEGYTPLEVKAFDKMVFRPQYRANLNEGVTDSKAVASFLSAHRLGDGSKVGALLLDHAMHVVGNLVLNENQITNDNAKALAGQMVNAAVHSTASSVVLFGDFAYDKMSLAVLRSELGSQSGNRVGMVDVVRVEGNHTRSLADGTLADSVRFSVANNHERIFISNAAKAVEDIKMEKATPEQWLKMLEKGGGLKAGEDKWIGLSDWLKSQKGTVTKQQVLDYIHQNQIQIEENKYSENADMVAAWEKEFQKTIARGNSLEELQKEIDELIESPQYYDELGNEPTQDDIDAYLTRAMREEYGDDFDRGYTINDGVIDYNIDPYEVDESDFMEFFADDPSVEKPINSVRLDYTTTGLDNKREIALTVPTIESWNKGDQVHFGDAGEGRAIAWIRFGDTKAPADKARVEELRERHKAADSAHNAKVRELKAKYKVATFAYLLEHVSKEERQELRRLSDESGRTLEELDSVVAAGSGKALFIDEIQSKRHQEARERGYRDDKNVTARVRELGEKRKALFDELKDISIRQKEIYEEMSEEAKKKGLVGRDGMLVYGREAEYRQMETENEELQSLSKRWQEVYRERQEIDREVGDIRNSAADAIPAAPFEKNWHELAFKRMLRLAAEEGYDYLVWTTGEQQAERYNIGDVVNRIRRFRSVFGEVAYELTPPNGGTKMYIMTDDNGNVESIKNLPEGGKTLADYVGKDLAQQMVAMEDGDVLNTENYRVGSEGMRGFYDEILPRFMNKYGKKWGVKVEDMTLNNLGDRPGPMTVHAVKVTPEMKESVMEGQVMFSVTEKPHDRGVADPRFMVPKVRGGWTEKKILRYLKDYGSHYGLRSAAAAISEFDSPEELKRYMFYHGTTNWVKQLRPSIIRSDRWVELYGGGGYGDKYWGISLTKNKKIATNFSGAVSRTVNVYPVILRKGATVIERPDFTDAWDAGEHIVELWEQGVDAVWIGNKDAGEEELLVLNPLAIVNIGAEDRYNVYQLGSPQNPVNIASDSDIKKMYDTAMEFFYADAPHRPMKPSRWDFDTDRRKSDGEYDAEMQEYERRMEEYEKSDEKRAYDELRHRAERDIRFSVANHNEEVFISNAQKAVEGIDMEKATPQQWLKMIESKGGLKAGEDKWIGLSAWLNSMKEADVKTLTKDQVLRYIKATQIRIEDANYAYAPMFSQNSLRNLESELKTRGESSIEDVLTAWDREFNDNKLEQYRQGLFSVNENNEIETAEPLAMPINSTRLKFTSEGLKNKREIALVVPTVEPYGQYDQVHFGDAGYGRAIAWVRFGDAVDPETGARVLFIDEIQSKRHQDAREKGYRGDLPDYEKPIIYPQNLQITESQYKYHTTFKGQEYSVGKGVVSDAESAKKYLADYINSRIEERNKELSNRRYTAVPDAPFEKNWYELAMKRMLRLAAEEGYDYVAWTTGDQQADRYNLGQVVDTIERSREFDDGEVRYDMYDKDGVGRGVFVKDGIITKSYYDELAGKRVEEVFGKGLSQKMLSLKDGEKISGEDIRVAGGEGMRGFYDEILPRFMNKYGKKWGVSVDNDGLVDASGILYPAHVVPVTEDMKQSVMQGQVMFSVRAADEARESGIGGVIGQENVGEFYMNLYGEMPKEMRAPIVESAMFNGLNVRQATEDYVSELAVKGDDTTGLLRMAENLLSEYAGETVTDNVARYILWRGSKGVNNGLLLDVAHDQFMRNHLDVSHPQVRFSVSDSVKEADTEAENVVDEAKEQLRKDKKELKDLLTAAKAMGLQKEYDKKTVEAVTNLAKRLLQDQYIDQLSRREVARLLGIIRTSVGRAPKTVKKNADAIVEIVIDNLLKREKEALKALTNGTGTKTNTTGVEVAGELDVQGQKTLKAYKEGIKLEVGNVDDSDDMNTLYGMRARLQSRLSSKDDAVRKEAEAEDAGLALAIEYKESIKALLDEEKSLEEDLKDAAAALKDGDMSKTDYEEFVRATQDAMRENHIEQVDSYKDFRAKMQEMLSGSREAKRAFMEREKERIEAIHHLANSDMQGRDASKEKRPTFKDKLANSPIVRFFAAPLATFDQMLRLFGEKNIAGEGYLWNKYMRGWLEAAEKAYIGQRDAKAALDKKASEVFGKDMLWNDIFDMERKMPKTTVKWWDEGGMKEHELSQGQLLYIYMVNKMADGRMKLRKMGIDEAAVEAIKRNMDSRFLELADWLQEEYLVDLRNKYNAVHERLFGASMAAIENYFPLKINKRDLTRNEDIAAPDYESLPSTTTGSIIKRRRNSKALDLLNADAFSVVIEHIEQMEQWAAFAEFNKDVNALLSYKRFRNQVQNMASVYGSGTTLWHNFKDVMRIAGNAYHPQVGRNQLDTAAVNLAKGVTSAKISFRVYTALKQFLSMPAFVADANIGYLAKDLVTPWKAWNWAMENLPVFEKRWKSRIAGDTRLMSTEDDWKVFRSKMYDKLSKWGMSPNAFVDAWTVAVGAHAMYQTRYNRYIKEGFSEEEADKKAKQDATVLYNETQQSNENAFVSAAQLDRTVFATAITVFRNSSMGFQRQVHDAIRNLGKHLKPGYKEQSIEFMTKQLVREGLSEEQAKEAAERRYNRSLTRDAVRLATFGFLVEFAWNLGGSLAYLLFGDDDDEKEKMLSEAFKHALIGGSMEGLSAGNVMSDAINMVVKGENLRNYDPTLLPILSDMKRVYSMMSYDPVAGANELVNLAVQAGIGVNPQTLTDAVVAVVDACNGDMETSREALLLIMRVLQVPQSQVDQIYIDELGVKASTAKRMTPTQMAKRYADYKFNRNAPLTQWAYPEELEEKRKAAHEKRFKKLVKERKEDK